MLVIKAFVNHTQIDEVWIHNTGELQDGFYSYQIEKPKMEHPPIIHKRSEGWQILTEKALKILNAK